MMERKRTRGTSERGRARFIERIIGESDSPLETLCGGCFAEIRGRHSVTVRGCRRILRYSHEQVILKMKRDLVVISGKRLVCLTYFSSAVTVEGLIDSFSFCAPDRIEV